MRANSVRGLIAAGGAAGAAGLLAILNRTLRDPAPTPNALGGEERRWRWRGYDIFATEAGSGPLLLLVHGIYAGSSSYEFRHAFPLLAERYRVVAIDLLGCGLSDKPDIAYSAELFVEQIVAALDAFGPRAASIVASSMGGAFAIRAAVRVQGRLDSLVVICPTGLGILDKPAGGRSALTSFVRSPLFGEAFFNALASRPSLTWFLKNQGYGDPASVTAEIVERYAQATHQPGARYVPAHFVGGALNCSVADDLPRNAEPMLIAWGERASRTSPPSTADAFLALAPHAQLETFAHSGLLPHEEEPELFVRRVFDFLARVGV